MVFQVYDTLMTMVFPHVAASEFPYLHEEPLKCVSTASAIISLFWILFAGFINMIFLCFIYASVYSKHFLWHPSASTRCFV